MTQGNQGDREQGTNAARYNIYGFNRTFSRLHSDYWVTAAIPLIAAVAISYAWPLSDSVDHEFFLSLSGAVLTALGLAFSVTLLMTDLGQSRARLEPRRIFTLTTWSYFSLCFGSVTWTLCLAYFAGESDSTEELCYRWAPKSCFLSEKTAARLSLFLIFLALLLLLPFVSYAYRRIDPRRIFQDLAREAVYASSDARTSQRMAEYARLTLTLSGDPDRGVLGAALTALGTGTSTSGRALPGLRQEFHTQVAHTVAQLLRSTRRSGANSRMVIEFTATWIECILDPQSPANTDDVEKKRALEVVRRFLDLAGANLRAWNDGEAATETGLASLWLINEMADICSKHRTPLSFAAAASTIRTCIEYRLSEPTGRLAYGSLRSLVKLTKKILVSDTDLGAHNVLVELLKGLEGISRAEPSAPIPNWTLREVGNVLAIAYRGGSASSHRRIVEALRSFAEENLSALLIALQEIPEISGLELVHGLFRDAVRSRNHDRIILIGQTLVLLQLNAEKVDEALSSFERIASSAEHVENLPRVASFVARRLQRAIWTSFDRTVS
ncbi:hypothetical protein ACWEOS_24000 [Micromonospora taraxaci]